VKLIFLTLLFLTACSLKGQSLQVAQNYLDHSDYKNAVPLFEKITADAKQRKDLSLQVSAQNGIADCYIDLGAYYKAMAILKQNIELLNKENSKNYFLLAKSHQLLATCYDKIFLLEDYLKECKLFYCYYKKAAPEKEIYKALYYAYVGRYYNMMTETEKAYYYSNTALKIYNKNKNENLVDGYIFYNAHLFTLRGNKSLTKNIFTFRDSVSTLINKRYPYNNLKKSRLLVSLAAPDLDCVEQFQYHRDKIFSFHANTANKYYQNLIAINDKYSGYYDSNSANAFSLSGLIYFFKKDYKNALKQYNEGIKRIAFSGDNESDFYSNNNLTLISLLNWKAWCLNEIYDDSKDTQLLYQIESALINMEKTWIRYSKQTLISKAQFNKNTYADYPYLLMVNNYKKLYDATGQKKYLLKIYEYDEKSRYSSLIENQIENVSPKEIQDEKRLKQLFEDLLLKKNAKIANAFSINSEKNFYILFNSLIKKENTYLNLMNNNFIKLNKAQAKLKYTDAIVYYNYTGNHNDEIAYSLVMTKDAFTIINLNKSKEKYSFYDFKSVDLITSLNQNNIESFKKLSYLFYKNYFEPVKQILPKTIKNICIVSYGKINTIPFDLIIENPSPKNPSFKDLPYLLKKYNFRYSLSTSLTNLNDLKTIKNNRFSVFSPTFKKGFMPNLNVASQQSSIISEEYKANYFKEEKATINSFTNSLVKDNTIALFSHGESNTKKLDEQKGVYLSDGFLTSKDIYKLKSNCSFLLLGACETSVGYVSQEGTINLARAFTAIGVKSMMLASWKIDEKSSTQIISSFLKYLDQGSTKSEALQKAKLDYLATAPPRMANPLYWAGLNITGNNETIRLHQPNYWWWGLGIIPVAVGGWYFRRRKRS